MNMRRQRRKRRAVRQPVYSSRASKGKVSTIVIMASLAIIAGYMAATYLIGPAMGLDMTPLMIMGKKSTADDKEQAAETILEDAIDTADESTDGTDGLAESGYVLQYGSFSTEEAAKDCVDDLKSSGIEAEILKKDGAYKVISPLFDTEEEARSKMKMQEGEVDVFLTQIP